MLNVWALDVGVTHKVENKDELTLANIYPTL